MNAAASPAADRAEDARRRFLARAKRPLLIGDWTRALFLHFEVPAAALQKCVPFDLDLWESRAFVSAVAFSMENLRPSFGGALGRWLFRPIARHDFFNVRTYVRSAEGPGIFFLKEWLNNRFCVLSGPLMYGLPYKFARIRYESNEGRREGRVGDTLAFAADISGTAERHECAPGSLDEFLIERYTAFTRRDRCSRCFDIWHQPWPQIPVQAALHDDRLLRDIFPWHSKARLIGANYSPGVRNVWMSAPRRVTQDGSAGAGVF
ncbi:MAG TPA: DUF2071 domain-containing protein [Verrucomicrobiae bacterium]|jgi:hypothetical protein